LIIESSAPTRVDLAGGTVDIWPLYLFHLNAVTVNFAIDLRARCRISTREDGRVLFASRDTRETAEFDGWEQLRTASVLKLLARLTYCFRPATGLEMETDCAAPAGSGLAGSSALNIAICGALNRLTGSGCSPERLIQTAKNVEAQVIDVPTGDQDYYPAFYGGVSAIHLTPRGVLREEIPVDYRALERRLVLAYSGRPRNSGINNWEVMKRHIDGDKGVFEAFEGIVRASNQMLDALRRGDFDRIDEALELEWSNRRKLSEGISSDEVEAAISAARSGGARAAKVCGAGGGGCILFTVPDGRRPQVQERLAQAGFRVLDYEIVREGLAVTVQ
jgi:D-glycero-alpha-D-manno-heptose-7-phosphate kinase